MAAPLYKRCINSPANMFILELDNVSQLAETAKSYTCLGNASLQNCVG